MRKMLGKSVNNMGSKEYLNPEFKEAIQLSSDDEENVCKIFSFFNIQIIIFLKCR